MNDTSSLNAAKVMLREGQLQDAIAIFEQIISDNSDELVEAAYCLGILHQSGNGIAKNINEAKKYYLIAEKSGYVLATYRLGGIYYRSDEFQKAYVSYRAVAQKIPSAAYWAHRLLLANKHLDDDPGACETYLNSAAQQGHVLALRVISMEYLSGKRGLVKILVGYSVR